MYVREIYVARVESKRAQRRADGQCIYCPVGSVRAAVPGKSGCRECMDYNAAKMRAKRAA